VRIFILSIVIIIFGACGFNKQIRTVDVSFDVPTNLNGTKIQGMSSLSSAISKNNSQISKSVAYETTDEDKSDIVLFIVTLVGKNYRGVQSLSENYFRSNIDKILSTRSVAIDFNNVPLGVDLILSVTIGKVQSGSDSLHPLGTFQFIRKEQRINLEQGQNKIKIIPEPGVLNPLVRMASYVGKFENCDGSGLNCDFTPFSGKEIEFLFCDESAKYLEDVALGESTSTDDSTSNDESDSTDNFSNDQDNIGQSATGPEEFYACSNCSDNSGLEDHLTIDSKGRISTEIFSGEPVQLFVFDDNRVKHTLMSCSQIIPRGSVGNYVFDKHLVSGQVLNTSEFISKLKTTEANKLFPGGLVYNTATSDVDLDGVSDFLERTQSFTSPFEVDSYYGSQDYTGLHIESADWASGVELYFNVDTNELTCCLCNSR